MEEECGSVGDNNHNKEPVELERVFPSRVVRFIKALRRVNWDKTVVYHVKGHGPSVYLSK